MNKCRQVLFRLACDAAFGLHGKGSRVTGDRRLEGAREAVLGAIALMPARQKREREVN